MNTKKLIKKLSSWFLKLTAFILYLKYAITYVYTFFMIPFAIFGFAVMFGFYNIEDILISVLYDICTCIWLFLAWFAIVLTYYFTAKLFGIFKFIDKKFKNIFVKIIVLIPISLVIYYPFKNNDFLVPSYIVVLCLPVAYFLYKYFNYLTIKHP